MYNFQSLKTRKGMCGVLLYFSFLSLGLKAQAMDKGTEQPAGNILRFNAIIQHAEIFYKIVKSTPIFWLYEPG